MALDFSDLRQVGENISPILNKRRAVKSFKNPMDKCTIVSILPKEIDEVKYTIEPGRFVIAPGTYEKPAILVVGGSSWWRDVDIEQPLIEIPVGSVQIADSVIRDYCNGMLGCDMADAVPGLFFVLGEITVADIKLKYREKLDETKVKQDNWLKILIRLADSLWARSNGNPLVISNEMRMAANMLNETGKPWLQNFEAAKLVPCMACGSLRNEKFPVCPSCKAVDPSHPLSKDLKFAV